MQRGSQADGTSMLAERWRQQLRQRQRRAKAAVALILTLQRDNASLQVEDDLHRYRLQGGAEDLTEACVRASGAMRAATVFRGAKYYRCQSHKLHLHQIHQKISVHVLRSRCAVDVCVGGSSWRKVTIVAGKYASFWNVCWRIQLRAR